MRVYNPLWCNPFQAVCDETLVLYLWSYCCNNVTHNYDLFWLLVLNFSLYFVPHFVFFTYTILFRSSVKFPVVKTRVLFWKWHFEKLLKFPLQNYVWPASKRPMAVRATYSVMLRRHYICCFKLFNSKDLFLISSYWLNAAGSSTFFPNVSFSTSHKKFAYSHLCKHFNYLF